MNGNASGGRVLPLPPEAVPILSMASAAFRVFPASFGAVSFRKVLAAVHGGYSPCPPRAVPQRLG